MVELLAVVLVVGIVPSVGEEVSVEVGADGRCDALSADCCNRRRPLSVFISSDSILDLQASL